MYAHPPLPVHKQVRRRMTIQSYENYFGFIKEKQIFIPIRYRFLILLCKDRERRMGLYQNDKFWRNPLGVLELIIIQR